MPNKGIINNPEGRPLGSRNEKSKQWDILAEAITGRHTERFNRVLDNLPDEDFLKAYILVIGYFRPKLAAQQVNVNNSLTMEQHKELISSLFSEIDENTYKELNP